MGLRHELIELAQACGKPHPALVDGRSVELLLEGDRVTSLWDHFGYEDRWQAVPPDREAEIEKLMS